MTIRIAPPRPRRDFAFTPGSNISAGQAKSVRFPVADILPGARALGDTTASPDFDGVFRRVPLSSMIGGRFYPTLPAAAAMLATGKTLEELKPKLTEGRLMIRFHGKSMTSDLRLKTYDSYQIGDVIQSWVAIEEKRQPKLPPSLFKDKIVFVAMTAAGLLDNHPSPIAPVYPGTEIIAAATDNLINGDGLTRAPVPATLALVLAALFLAGLASRLSSRHWFQRASRTSGSSHP